MGKPKGVDFKQVSLRGVDFKWTPLYSKVKKDNRLAKRKNDNTRLCVNNRPATHTDFISIYRFFYL